MFEILKLNTRRINAFYCHFCTCMNRVFMRSICDEADDKCTSMCLLFSSHGLDSSSFASFIFKVACPRCGQFSLRWHHAEQMGRRCVQLWSCVSRSRSHRSHWSWGGEVVQMQILQEPQGLKGLVPQGLGMNHVSGNGLGQQRMNSVLLQGQSSKKEGTIVVRS